MRNCPHHSGLMASPSPFPGILSHLEAFCAYPLMLITHSGRQSPVSPAPPPWLVHHGHQGGGAGRGAINSGEGKFLKAGTVKRITLSDSFIGAWQRSASRACWNFKQRPQRGLCSGLRPFSTTSAVGKVSPDTFRKTALNPNHTRRLLKY